MRKTDKQNALVVAAVALCFMLTLALCRLLDGEGFLLAFEKSDESVKCYLLCGGEYEDIALARAAADVVKSRGGAGYVIVGERCEVVLAAYPDEETALSVAEGGGAGEGTYVKAVTVGEASADWAEGELRTATETALGYFDVVFDCLYAAANGIESGKMTPADARNSVTAMRERTDDMRAAYNAAAYGVTDPRCTEVKLALVTAVALLDNAEPDASHGAVKIASSLRYQCVQLVLCREALVQALK